MRLTIVQYAGDYRESWERFERGGKSTYQAQRYSVNLVGHIAARSEQVAVICALTSYPYDEVLPNKVRAIGAGFSPGFQPKDLVPIVARTRPDRLLLTTPMRPILKWARTGEYPTLAQLADSFQGERLIDRLRNRLLAAELNHRNVEWVSNHGIASCLSLAKIGVKQEKIIPWDWPPSHKPMDYPVRQRHGSEICKLIYVGTVMEEKGVGDLLRAMTVLKGRGLRAELTIVGPEPDSRMREMCSYLGNDQQVTFAGLISNEDIPEYMRSADIVVIPSRHEYPEGLPLTIYEALSARTPIVASDHPMFEGALLDGESAMIFAARDAEALAEAIERLASDPELYARLSENSASAWNALQLPVSWGELVVRWLSGKPSDRDWLTSHALTSGIYEEQIAARSTRPL